MKRIIILFAILLSSVTACQQASAEVVDGIAANVNGQLITYHELRQRLKELKLEKSKATEVLNKMIDESLVRAEIQKRGLSATAAEIDEAVSQVSRQNDLHSPQELAALLKEQGLTEAQFRDNLKTQIEQSKFVSYVMGAKIKINEADARNYYETHYNRNEGEQLYRLRSIFAEASAADAAKRKAAKTRIQGLQEKLKKGADFAAIARKNSDGPTASSGGQLGDFKRDELQDDFLKAVSQLKPGQVTGVLERNEGFYLLKLDGMVKGSPPAYKSVQAEITRRLQNQEMERLFRIWVQQVKEKSFIDVKLKDTTQL